MNTYRKKLKTAINKFTFRELQLNGTSGK